MINARSAAGCVAIFVLACIVESIAAPCAGRAAGLFGIASAGGPLPGPLVLIDTSSGAMTPIGGTLGPDYAAQQLSTIVVTTETYCFIG